MDFLSLENALLIQGGEPYYGYGWSDPTANGAGVDDGSTRSSIIGPSQTSRGSIFMGEISYFNANISSDSNNNKLSTPIDPILKHLKREYASSAGPQDILASTISPKELEFLSSATSLKGRARSGTIASLGSSTTGQTRRGSGMKPPPSIMISEDQSFVANNGTTILPNQQQQQQQQQQGGSSALQFDVARSATPLTSGGGGARPAHRAISTASLDMNQQFASMHGGMISGGGAFSAEQQKQRRQLMPSFCFSPSSHTDNLLQTTPHLRHLCVASTDMSGEGVYDDSKNIFAQLFQKKKDTGDGGVSGSSSAIDYHTSLLRQRANRRAALELASFMRILSNETPETFDSIESEVYSKVFALVHSKTVRADDRLAGVVALDALLSVPSADEERRAIRFGSCLSNGLKITTNADYEFLHATARALGRMAMGSANVDRVEFEIGRSLEWLRSDRSDRRLAAVLVLRELARCAPTVFYSNSHNVNVHHHAATAAGSSVTGGGPAPVARDGTVSHLAGLGGTNDFLDHIMPVLNDPQPIVRVCAADALSECLAILMDRQKGTMTAPLCTLHSSMMDGLKPVSVRPPLNVDANAYALSAAMQAHGSLLVVSEMLKHSRNFILPRFDEICVAVLKFMKHKLVLIRLEVIRLIPRLAQRCPEVYGRKYLTESLQFLIANASTKKSTSSKSNRIDVKPIAFTSIGLLALAMSYESMGGGDITSSSVRILPINTNIPFPPENNDVDYHLVEFKDDYSQDVLEKTFSLISYNIKYQVKCRYNVLGCFASFVEALGIHAAPHVMGIVDDMFESGLSEDLIKCLHSIMRSIPSKQLSIERRLFEEISSCLAGKSVDLFTIRKNTRPTLEDVDAGASVSSNSLSSLGNNIGNTQPTLERQFMSSMSLSSMNPSMRPPQKPELEVVLDVETTPPRSSQKKYRIVINKSNKQGAVDKIVLSLQTLRSIGQSYMQVHASEDGNLLLPFLRDVISMYFEHPSSSVRREAAITCCLLLLPFGPGDSNKENEEQQSLLRFKFGDVSGDLFEEVLQKLLRLAVSDISPVVRLCIVRGLDERYDLSLSLNQGGSLFLMLEDEALSIRVGALQILGRISRLNPARILPGLRRVLVDLIIELRCGGDSGSKEIATRLIIIFLREEALQRLTRPFISSILDALPLANVAPRLATVSLEAVGEVATVAHNTINPRLRQLVVENIQDNNTSKQRISLWALGKIAYGTNYVIQPYLDYPQLMSQASDILPTTKKAPWELRREVFRTFGILGAFDPDRFGSDHPTRKGGGKGGGYFLELDDAEKGHGAVRARSPTDLLTSSLQIGSLTSLSAYELPALLPSGTQSKQLLDSGGGTRTRKDSDNDEPAHLYMYEQYAMTSQPLSKLSPAKRLSPSDEAFYPTVAVQALMRILTDTSLSNLHGMVMKAVMFIFNALGMKSVPFLKTIVPHILLTVNSCGQHGMREALLQQISNLSVIVREHLRPYLPAIFEVVEEFWGGRHLSTLCSLVERIAIAVPDDFRTYVPLLVRQILASIDAIDLSEWSVNSSLSSSDIVRLELMLRHIQGIKDELGGYIHLVVPALVRLTDDLINPDADDKNATSSYQISPPLGSGRSTLAVEAIDTLSILLQTFEVNPDLLVDTSVKSNSALPARVGQPFLRILGSNVIPNQDVGSAMIGCLCICVRQFGAGRWLSFYHDTARGAILAWQSAVGMDQSTQDDQISNEIISNLQHLPIDIYDEVVNDIKSLSTARWDIWNTTGSNEEYVSGSDFSIGRTGGSDLSLSRVGETSSSLMKSTSAPSIQPVQNYQSTTHKTNISNLQKAWDVTQRSTREDWDQWMRNFSIQLLREAPSPALRACAELAQAYQPLAQELFQAGFVCCWAELNEQYRTNLKFSLEVVFSADASLEILQLLLNLAEFMEHDCNSPKKKKKIPGLNIDISILAELALKCRAYARALHYKEREYIMGRGGACVEQLIDINKKLDIPEAALGILAAAKIEISRRGGQALVSSSTPSHRRTDSLSSDKNLMSYSVITSYDSAKQGENNSSWAGDIDYPSWLAKLGSWAEAVGMYEDKLSENPHDVHSLLGCLQCYIARGQWTEALNLARQSWGALSIESNSSMSVKRSQADNYKRALKFCAQSAWRLGRWDDLENYSSQLMQGHQGSSSSIDGTKLPTKDLPELDFDGAFYRSVLYIHRAEWDAAAKSIDSARKAMDSQFTAHLAESYKRAYPSMVDAQELSELEEIISFRQLEMRVNDGMKLHAANRPDAMHAKEHLLNVWRQRLDGCRVDAEVHSSILAVRSLVQGPTDEVDATITLSALSRQAEAYRLAERTLLDPLARMRVDLNSLAFGIGVPTNLGLGITDVQGDSIEGVVNGNISVQMNYGQYHEQFSKHLFADAGGEERLFIQHKLYFAYIKHLWATDRRDEAMNRLSLLCNIVDLTTQCGHETDQTEALRMNCWLRKGDWKIDLLPPGATLTESLSAEVVVAYKRATDAVTERKSSYRAWHSWALINFRLAEQSDERSTAVRSHIIAAVKGFVRAISVGTKRWSASVQQDMLNLLSCLFKYGGELEDVASTIKDGLASIQLEAWLGVLPQLLARIHIKAPAVRSVLHPLLVRLGANHPQALIYPLSVLLKSPVVDRKLAAESLMNSLKAHSNALVEEALMVSSELIRVAILWLEQWHEGLEDASRLYYGEGNVSGMLDVLVPLHTELEKGANTRREQDFLKSFGRDLLEAHHHIKDYIRLIRDSGQTIPTEGGFMSQEQAGRPRAHPANAEAEAALNQAWDLYYTVFRRINKQLPGLTTLELSQCSPALYNARNLELGVPGSYRVDGSYIKIQKFISDVNVITSKQRPRKITIRGNDGKDYVFLLKGHEDLRQDERVMQLFGLVNALLARDRRTNRNDLNIQRYAIAPLSHNAGVVGWVPHCDTLHCLIRDYRESLSIPLNLENREMIALAPNYDSLPAMQKVEVFTEALDRTTGKGNDLYEVLWTKSTNSEEWLERRTNFTRSLAVMSMVGYILGLGDRHPSNLMLDQISGRILHIDFGDCFEVAMHRDKFPEKVPFRLTRMLTRAMEVSGIEGSYRSTCERTMGVLRDNKDSLVAMLEAFVYDPLISWRLLEDQSSGGEPTKAESPLASSEEEDIERLPSLEPQLNTAVAHTQLTGPIQEEQNEDEEEDDEGDGDVNDQDKEEAVTEEENKINVLGSSIEAGPSSLGALTSMKPSTSATPYSTSHAKSLQMYSEMRALAANLSTASRIASITGAGSSVEQQESSIEHSIARSRIDKSIRQRELLSMVEGALSETENEEALNERALKVIRRVQDKLTGTDFHSPDDEEVGEPLDVQDQVQRLIVQATSSENLSQLFIGWCAFW